MLAGAEGAEGALALVPPPQQFAPWQQFSPAFPGQQVCPKAQKFVPPPEVLQGLRFFANFPAASAKSFRSSPS